jgi:hypothetical protein
MGGLLKRKAQSPSRFHSRFGFVWALLALGYVDAANIPRQIDLRRPKLFRKARERRDDD